MFGKPILCLVLHKPYVQSVQEVQRRESTSLHHVFAVIALKRCRHGHFFRVITGVRRGGGKKEKKRAKRGKRRKRKEKRNIKHGKVKKEGRV